jgi:hypothetical protein
LDITIKNGTKAYCIALALFFRPPEDKKSAVAGHPALAH